MKYQTLLAVGVVVLFAGADATEEAVKKEMAKLEGAWTVVSAERDGSKASEDVVKKVKITFAKDKLVVKQGDKTIEMSYALDPSKNPKTIDITYLDGDRKGEVSQGIYALDGDNLKICMHRGSNRPPEFETRADSQRHLIVLKRQKP